MRDVKEPEVRRAEILKAAMGLFMEKGYMNTTTQDIVDRVKISRGLLYYHFKNKEDILYSIVEKYSDPLLKNIGAIAYDKQKTAVEKIREFVDLTMISSDSISLDRIELQKNVDLDQNRYVMDKLAHKLIENLSKSFTHILEQGIKEKAFSVEYPLETATFLMTSYVFVSNHFHIAEEGRQANEKYLTAFKLLLERSLNADQLFLE